MALSNTSRTWKDKVLFTPGPLTTSRSVKQAMLQDLGSRDHTFIGIIKDVRERLLGISGADKNYETILMQGSGTFSIEAVISSTMPPDGKLLIIINGAYGKRMAKIAAVHRIPTVLVEGPENLPPDLAAVEAALKADPAVSMVAVVHCETTTGIINPIREIGALAAKYGKKYFVDSMSILGAVTVDLAACHVDYIVSSSNKCVEGVPGFAFIVARRASLLETRGRARTLSLDILDQLEGFEAGGQFRFTPPVHSLIAFHQALLELEEEGGVAAREARYRGNRDTCRAGMRELGFKEYLAEEHQGHIITSYRYPDDPKFDFEKFYNLLNGRGFVIYPGKVSNAACFRLGHIGRIGRSDVLDLLAAIRDVSRVMGFNPGA